MGLVLFSCELHGVFLFPYRKQFSPNSPKEDYEYMSTRAAVYSDVGDPFEMQKNPAYESTQFQRDPAEGDHVYDYIPGERDETQGQKEESTHM